MTRYTKVSFDLTKLSHQGFCQFIQATQGLVQGYANILDEDKDLKQALDNLGKGIAQLEQVLKDQGQTRTTLSLSELDKARDKDFRDLVQFVKLHLTSRQVNKRQAAESLFAILLPYRESVTANLGEQTSLTKGLLQKLDERENKTKLNLLGGMDFFLNLKESHEAFQLAYLRRIEEKGAFQKGRVKNQRQQLHADYKNIYQYLLCRYYFNADTPLKAVLASFNDVRLSYRDQLRRQDSLAKTKAEKRAKQAQVATG